ncbi:MAG: response regulator [Comamonadaceae bacterium]|nr:MAG: response regulator [Comamonadaceae bacterium]
MDLLRDGEKPALILSDFMMPVMNGAEFGRALSQNESLSQIPFVFMSATSEDVVQRVFDDYDAFLVKPIELDSLLTIVKRLIDEKSESHASAGRVDESTRQVLQGMRTPPRD